MSELILHLWGGGGLGVGGVLSSRGGGLRPEVIWVRVLGLNFPPTPPSDGRGVAVSLQPEPPFQPLLAFTSFPAPLGLGTRSPVASSKFYDCWVSPFAPLAEAHPSPEREARSPRIAGQGSGELVFPLPVPLCTRR